MKIIIDDYMNGVSKEEISRIINTLKNNKYSVLEINLNYPYEYHIQGGAQKLPYLKCVWLW